MLKNIIYVIVAVIFANVVSFGLDYYKSSSNKTDATKQSAAKPVYADNKVILYGTSWCPYCKQARELLAEKNIAFTNIDIETSSEGKARYDVLGGNGIPVFEINGEAIDGFDEESILAALKTRADVKL